MSTPPSLTEFLLARYAEDEEALPEWRRRVVPGSVIGNWILYIGDRMLADVQAKRALVQELDRMQRDEMGWDGIEFKVMAHLALPYSDHPDYREEWKP